MKYADATYSTPNVPALRAKGLDPPHDLIQSGAGGVWFVRRRPLVLMGDGANVVTSGDWKLVADGNAVVVPLLAYHVPTDRPCDIIAMVAAAVSRVVANNKPFLRVHVSVGDPVEELDEGGFRVWVGVACRVR